MTLISPSRRVRRTPFSDGVEAAGVEAFTVYNRMFLPTMFRSVEEDYHHLKSAVQLWDVSCERQVQITGPDARELIQLLTPRDLAKMKDDQCFYVPIVDETGGMLNDPVLLQPDADRYWISIADSDLLLWVKGFAAARGFDVEVTEPDVSPLGIQGPKSDDLAAALFGDKVRDLRFFRHMKVEFQGREFTMSRTGYSKQGGFELYLEGSEYGMMLWDALMEAGKSMDVHAGCPNLIERVEGGLLSYGNDMTEENSPHECGLGKFCNSDADFLGKDRIAREAAEGPDRRVAPISIDGKLPLCDRAWPVLIGDTQVGQVTSAIWSPDFNTNVAIGMINRGFDDPGTSFQIQTQAGLRDAVVAPKFWN